MNSNSDYESLVSRYLDGEMSFSEIDAFNKQLEGNPELREELQLQEQIINSVKEMRKAELKARLSNIQVGGVANWYQYFGVKTAAVVTFMAMIGYGAYYFTNESTDESISQVTIEAINTERDEFAISDVPAKPEVKLTESEAVIPEKEQKETQRAVRRSNNPIKDKKENEEAGNDENNNVAKPFVPENPDMANEPKDDVMLTDATASTSTPSAGTSKVEVSTFKSSRNKYQYKFFENKLFLYGDFSDAPYEIIEVNASQGNKYYLKYKDYYYHLVKNAKTMPLEKIEDEEILEQLRIIKNNK